MNDTKHRLTIKRVKAAKEGTCNFCTDATPRTVISVKGTGRTPVVVRFCMKCLAELKKRIV